MNSNRPYIIELLAVCIGIIYSPMIFYFYLRYKLSLENEQIDLFRIAYTKSLKKPKTEAAQYAETTAYVALITLVALGYLTDEVVFDFLAGAIGFSLGVEWLWRMEVRESPRS